MARATASRMGLTAEALESLRAQRAALEALTAPTIDADIHLSDLDRLVGPIQTRYYNEPYYYHGRPISAEEAVLEMDMAGIDLAVAWQNPAATNYGGEPAGDYEDLWQANRYIAAAARRFPNRILPAGWTDPRALGVAGAVHLARRCVEELGFPVVKLNPAQNRYSIDGPEVLAVVEAILELGARPAFHFGADTPFTPAEGLAAVARHCAGRPLLAVHMGGGGAGYVEAEPLYQAARRLGLDHPNVHYVLSAKRDCHIEGDLIACTLAGAPFVRNLSFGSDAPYGKMAWNFGGARALLATLVDPRHPEERVRQNRELFREATPGYLGGNLRDFWRGAIASVLATPRQ